MSSNFNESDGSDITSKFVTKDYLIDVYPYLNGLGNNIKMAGLWNWGYNSGDLGDSTNVSKSSPVQTIAGGTNWKQVSKGRQHIAAIKTDGTLWLCGLGSNGSLGDSTSVTKSSPVQTIAGGTNWKQVSGGTSFTAAIKTDGTLWLWGTNANGQLGDSTTTSKSSPIQTITGGTNWKQVACGSIYSAAIKTDGTLWAWGSNFYGNLGNSDRSTKSSPVQTIAGGTDWKQVACGYRHSAAIKTDGTLWLSGGNSFGQLGDSTIVNKSSPVQTIAGGTNWKQVACGYYHTSAIKTDGTLWSFGGTTMFGQIGCLGDSTTDPKSSPVQTIAGGTNWKQVACGDLFSVAIKTDGTLWSWGRGDSGQLGDNNTVSKSSPVQTIAGGTNWKQAACGSSSSTAIQEMGDDF
jgi:alpha-tubulin suppressor-like RCC1 family protein